MKKIFLQNTTGKKECSLSAKLGAGGEGTVYAITDNSNLCVKIYHSCVNTHVDANGKAQVDANGKAQLVAHHEQKLIAEKVIKILEVKQYEVATELTKAGMFWKAEDYHQDYYEKSGKLPYCHTRRKLF